MCPRRTKKKQIPFPFTPHALRYQDHYIDVFSNAGHVFCPLILDQAENEGPCVNLVYHWEIDLTHEEADQLDSRARAFVSCAIYDAAKLDKIKCKRGPLHGRRPSWLFKDVIVPISLMSAGFDYDAKKCWMTVGPIYAIRGVLPGYVSIAWQLARAFKTYFSEITV